MLPAISTGRRQGAPNVNNGTFVPEIQGLSNRISYYPKITIVYGRIGISDIPGFWHNNMLCKPNCLPVETKADTTKFSIIIHCSD
jgi:hypothetical protein